MPKKNVSFNINLMPQDPFFNTFLGKTLKWALSVGRYIVIFTELIVILSFVTRFSLDRQVTDLNESINQKSIIIDSYGDLENQVRKYQNIVEQYTQIEQQINIADVFPELSRVAPPDVRLQELIIKSSKVSLVGTTRSQTSLNTLITNIQLSGTFFNVSVDKIEVDTEAGSGFTFVINADTRLEEAKKTTAAPKDTTNPLDRTQGL